MKDVDRNKKGSIVGEEGGGANVKTRKSIQHKYYWLNWNIIIYSIQLY